MSKYFKLLLIGLLFTGAVTTNISCGSSEPAQEEPKPPVDTDGDGITDEEELKAGTDPNKADTDDDGLKDSDEINRYNTDPLNADSDADGLKDGEEVLTYRTNPLNKDTDGDGLSDLDEVKTYRTNPNSADSDGDGLSDYDEINKYKTNPNNPDTDGDGFTDAQEVEMGFDPNDNKAPVYIASLSTVNFDFDKSNIDKQAAQSLTENVELLRDNANYKIRVDAYTDHVGGDQYNLRLSKRRANSVLAFYKKNGIAEDRIEARGLGKAPVPCATEDPNGRGCRSNRRAESLPVNPYKYTPKR
ncbi:OmpA family protein [bacterium]|nr:MAG: OmpA family protein [bacterium]